MNPFRYNNLMFFTMKTSKHISYKSHFSSLTLFLSFSSQPQKTKVSVHDYLVKQHGFPPSAADKVSHRRTFIKDSEKTLSIIEFFKQSGFSMPHIVEILERCPKILCAKLEKTIKPKLKIFHDFGYNQNDVVDIIASNPTILHKSSENQLLPSLVILKKVLGTNESVARLLKRSSCFLVYDLKKNVIPNIEFMISCGISKAQITNAMFNFPRSFVMKPEALKEVVKRVDELGVDRNSRMLLYAIRTISSMSKESWDEKLQLLQSLGWSMDEILATFRKAPFVLAVSDKKIKEIVEYLLDCGRCDIAYLVAHPGILIFSLERRIKPRVHVCETLMEMNLISRRRDLFVICKLSDANFFARYVYPHQNEVGNLFKSKKVP